VRRGRCFSAGRLPSTPEGIKTLAESLLPTDWVALEVTGSSWKIVRLLEPHVSKIIVVPLEHGRQQARAKTDRLDARTLARRLWTGELEAVWVPPEWITRMRRRLHRREQLVRARSRAKNEIHAVLMRRLKGRPPVSDLFGVKGRGWLRGLELPLEEAETAQGCLRHIEFQDGGARGSANDPSTVGGPGHSSIAEPSRTGLDPVEQLPEVAPDRRPPTSAPGPAPSSRCTTSTCHRHPRRPDPNGNLTLGDLRQQRHAIRVRLGVRLAAARSDMVGHFLVQRCQP
jgi:Transposase